MSFIPTFGMILVVASSYQIWYEFHTLVFAVWVAVVGKEHLRKREMHNLHDSFAVAMPLITHVQLRMMCTLLRKISIPPDTHGIIVSFATYPCK